MFLYGSFGIIVVWALFTCAEARVRVWHSFVCGMWCSCYLYFVLLCVYFSFVYLLLVVIVFIVAIPFIANT